MFALPDPPQDFLRGRDEVLAELEHWLARGAVMTPQVAKPLAVILSDVEGCMNFDPLTYDHAVLSRLRGVNDAASPENAIPYITLCTGRQSPFVDAFSAFVGVRIPVIFEGGCGLFFPTEQPGGRRHRWHPAIAEAEQRGDYGRLEEIVLQTAKEYGATRSLGKGRLLTFHGTDRHPVDALLEAFRSRLADAGVKAEVTRSANAVDISVPGVTKGSAVDWLLSVIQEYGGPLWSRDQIIGIGDAPNDLSFLEVVGRSVAPRNARDSVKAVVTFVSDLTDAKAVAEAVIYAIRFNLAAA